MDIFCQITQSFHFSNPQLPNTAVLNFIQSPKSQISKVLNPLAPGFSCLGGWIHTVTDSRNTQSLGKIQFSRNNMYVRIPEKLSEIHLHAWLFSNPCGKVQITVGISWSPDLRVQLKLSRPYCFGSRLFQSFRQPCFCLFTLYISIMHLCRKK